MRTPKSWVSIVIPLLSVVAIAGCGSSSSSSSATSAASSAVSSASSAASSAAGSAKAGAVAAVAKLVPAAIAAKKTMTVAADASYAPNEFFAPDGHTIIGMDADLSKALAAAMGLKANIVNETFDGIIPGLAAGKYDMGASSFTDTKAREKVVNFVTYFIAGTSFYVKSSGGPPITSLGDLCGHTVAAEKGTTQQADATAQAAKCQANGKAPVTLQVYNDQNAV